MSIACIWWVVKSVDIEQVIVLLKQVKMNWFFLAVLVTILSYALRSLRWPFFFSDKPPSFYDSYRCLNAGFFMNNVLPARIGEIVRAHLGGKITKQSRSVVLATIAGERLADGVSISLLFVFSSIFAAKTISPDKISGIYWVAGLFFAASFGTIFVLLARKKVFVLLQKLGSIMPGHLSSYTLLRIERFIRGLEPLLEPFRLVVLSAFSLLVWGLELFVYYCVVQAFGQDLGLSELVLFLTVVNFSSLIPAAPGGLGVIEAVATLVLTKIGIDSEVALSMVATQHLIQYAVVGFPGAYFFFSLGGRKDGELDYELDSIDCENTTADVSFSDNQAFSLKSTDKCTEVDMSAASEALVEVSVVIPAYNEESRLPKTLLSVLEYLKENYESFEIIVVDDGSSDKTTQVVRQFQELASEVKLLALPQNRGKGFAVKSGVLNSQGKRILYNDADGASPIYELERLEKALNSGADIAIGSRARFSVDTEVETVWYRKFMGRVFNGIVNFIILPGIADTQCGFKFFYRGSALTLFQKQTSEGFSFDVELLFLARKAGCTIVEVPINWTNVPGSKVNLGRDSLLMLKDIFIFRFRDLMGKYGSTAQMRHDKETYSKHLNQ